MKFLTDTQKEIFNDLWIGDKSEEVTNPYSGVSCMLTPEQVALYDYIKGAEMVGDPDFGEALHLFRYNWPKEYYILLD